MPLPETVTLELIFEHQQRMMQEVRALREDMTIIMARCERIDRQTSHLSEVLPLLLEEVKALHAGYQRQRQKLERLAEKVEGDGT